MCLIVLLLPLKMFCCCRHVFTAVILPPKMEGKFSYVLKIIKRISLEIVNLTNKVS